ncbi:hypothetical protein [Manganibacter manganicus]|uniref:Uncharacterized protein n=1 Tax=Manganibacter manganicus TaxID=1873176 RepID=A0A1V8RP23_9HYPH|nr:hypothetical protein [Pseudaminobacter manganicus]OQM74937.1 hypothetical protein BFN67_04800 [Pseudaminobacter manganicus]
MKYILIASVLVLAGCQSTEVKPLARGTAHSLSAADRAAIKRDVASSLKDPESARFGSIQAVTNSSGVVSACGTVNAKNSFGGYVGERPFAGVLYGGHFGLAGLGSDGASTIAIRQKCAEMGITI